MLIAEVIAEDDSSANAKSDADADDNSNATADDDSEAVAVAEADAENGEYKNSFATANAIDGSTASAYADNGWASAQASDGSSADISIADGFGFANGRNGGSVSCTADAGERMFAFDYSRDSSDSSCFAVSSPIFNGIGNRNGLRFG